MSGEHFEHRGGWSFWVDRGGTFTDVVARTPSGELRTHKLLSENPERYEDAALEGMRQMLGLGAEEPLADARIEAVKMGTTVATNALLERKGERTLLLITRGFADALRIGYQNRPDLFAREIVLPELVYERVAEVGERLDARGDVLEPLDEVAARAALEAAFTDGLRSVAVVLMHGYRYPAHEARLGEIAAEVGFSQISLSHEVSPLMKLVGRGDTTVVDAYLSPILRRYVDRVAAALGVEPRALGDDGASATVAPGKERPASERGPRLFFMQSSGGLTAADQFRGKDSILSGPAGGIVGAVATARAAGFERVITFDMGGTSTDVAHWAGEYERAFETEVAGVRMRTPMLRIHTVAAGGGSILHFDGQRQRVGPDSAGADPGPACYRRGGPLTVTDANVLLGVLQPRHFPHVFGPAGDQPMDPDVVRLEFEALRRRIADESGVQRSAEQVADGFVEIAVAGMAEAIRKISVQRGHDVTEYVLHCFGGAGGQHACRVAAALGMTRVLIHPLAGVLSAYGMGVAAQRELRERAVEAQLRSGLMPELRELADELAADCRGALEAQGVEACSVGIRTRLHLRTEGSDTHLPIVWAGEQTMREDFVRAHRQQFGFEPASEHLMVEAVAVEAVELLERPQGPCDGLRSVPAAQESDQRTGEYGSGDALPIELVRAYLTSRWRDVPVFRREDLAPGSRIAGPAIVIEANATTVVDVGWMASVTELGDLVLERGRASSQDESVEQHSAVSQRAGRAAADEDEDEGGDPDPVLLEVFNNLFMSVAEQMGVVLRNTAYSVNIKERLDFSCAVFDVAGDLVANAPHMPVHLGSMPESVRTVLRKRRATLRPGDVYMLNSPYDGGTHLPDVTVVTPVYDDAGEELLFFVASRGHHAEIGGITPGSMPPHSQHIEEEGVLIDDFLLVEQGRLRREETLEILRSGRYPSRNPRHNLGDLQAQIAANEKGAQELRRLVSHFGLGKVRRYMQHVQDNAEESVRRALAALELSGEGGTTNSFRVEMDSGSVVCVRVEIDRERRSAVVDFAGTSEQQPDNFNITSAVATAAVLYVLRLLVDIDIPLNGGLLKPLEIRVPQGSLLDPQYPAAVVAGNVETSQVITDALLGALGLMAECQGTMNNFTFGNEVAEQGGADAQEPVQYYETICGGAGAGPGFDGASGVHTHMTNTRLTDPEVLEWRFPVLLEEFSLRRGSGGAGKWRGGDGVVRKVRFLRSGLVASILSNHRRIPPYGLHGGGAGAVGRNHLQRADGSVSDLGPTASVEVGSGDVFVIETPGGGGWELP